MNAPNPSPQTRLSTLTLRDAHRLGRRLEGTRKIRDAAKKATAVAAIETEMDAAEAQVAARHAAVPVIRYPAELPVSERRDDIAAAIRDHQVVIVAGETGSGKTTQIPKICLELGRGVRGQIGHTQPRRLAARTVADRIAEELGTPLGSTVGYKVRFTDRGGDDTLIKLMTDGILLAELQNDRDLLRYDTLVIDEAHERSLNIDFILGYLAQLLPRRPDLKVVITSATIETERFAQHFRQPSGEPAPVVEVSGRTYPVELRYRPLVLEEEVDEEDEDEVAGALVRDPITAIGDAVTELAAEGPGDILVFLSGEREIRDAADALGRLDVPHLEILPLYARLSSAEQHRVFQPHTGRRVVLATNVAETSLTVPGVKYVVDPGTARISRYSHRLKVQRLPIERVSQASANQRKGRSGRTSPGICIRLYDEQDFLSRPEYTEPEILRTNLASVILQMTAIGLGDIAKFPFIDPPDRRNITDGVALLQELGALDETKRLTEAGRRLAQLPVDPRLGRMVLEADRNGCLDEVSVVTAALSIQDPRERPVEHRTHADQLHARFTDPDSDFVTYLNLWRYVREKQQELSSSAFRRLCRSEYLNYLRVREWQDINSQLRQVTKSLGLVPSTSTDPARLHQSLLAGLLSQIGLREGEKREYLGARNARFAIFPGSSLAKKPPRFVMSAELVETSRLWARVNARIEPEWVEPLAGHLVKRSYSEPHWEKKQASVVAVERVTLYGVPIVVGRRVSYGRIDPVLSRELFIRNALVEGDWQTTHHFFRDNAALLETVAALEDRVRRRDILVDEDTLYSFYDQRIPADVVSGRHFDTWWKKTRHTDPRLLTFTREFLVNAGRGDVSPDAYPDVWRSESAPLPLSYEFAPGTTSDGVTVDVPLPMLGQVAPEDFDWQVPGLREDLVVALLRSLPKAIRTNFVPAPDFARAVLTRITPAPGLSLIEAVTRELRRMTGVTVPHDAWDLSRVPDHLRLTYRVVDGDREVARGKDLAALQAKLKAEVRATVTAAAPGIARTGLTAWDFGPLPRTLEQDRAGFRVTAYPALVDEGTTVGVEVFDSAGEQAAAMIAGTRRLLLLSLPNPATFLQGRLTNQQKLALSRNPHRNVADLLRDCAGAAVDRLVDQAGGPAWDPAGFTALRDAVRADLVDTVAAVVSRVERALAAQHAVDQRIGRMSALDALATLTDVKAQISRLIYPGFVTATGWTHLGDLPRYLSAVERRLDRLGQDVARDRNGQARIAQVQKEYDAMLAALSPSRRRAEAVAEIRWMIEELRVNVFAQALGTPYPVSEQRIYKAMDAAEAS
ncbi:ATP-dependent helicase [Asanoa ishikariensis]|uniref:RNA helicase n=1 Tax=Asanoa ishikariensis TaxID=137265 RepID=A0A1H3S5J4_9ACTN|nr:ATP-dependent RNA helicase HrpA [Asanoa ishikariensis]GIF66444.1 ATP-dependent helicase [Asanoa ishikariensis]SDZ33373.1 ATP-dependent helicase HrpA [Asanoa ishikariensis]